MEAADHHNIKLFFPRSQTTRQMQPMEKSVFVPFDHYLDEDVLLFCNHSTDPLSPEHSRVLTLNSCQSILSILR